MDMQKPPVRMPMVSLVHIHYRRHLPRVQTLDHYILKISHVRFNPTGKELWSIPAALHINRHVLLLFIDRFIVLDGPARLKISAELHRLAGFLLLLALFLIPLFLKLALACLRNSTQIEQASLPPPNQQR